MQRYLCQIFEKKFAVLIVFSLICSILYIEAFSIGFLSDDYGFLWKAKEFGWSAFEHNFNDPFYIPFSHVIAMSLYSLVGDNALIFHVLQLLIHALIGWQLYLFLKEYLNTSNGVAKIAFISGLLFLIFPYQTEAVLWLSSKSYGYSLFFGLLCIRQFFKYYDSKKNAHLFLCSIFLICSITTKEFGYLLPVIIALLLWNKGKLSFKPIPIFIFFIIIISSVAIRWIVLSDLIGGYGTVVHINLSVIAWHYLAYIVKFFTHIRYSDDSMIFFYCMSVLTVVSFGPLLFSMIKERQLRKNGLVTVCLFILSLLPVISLEISSLNSIESDRYSYWASIIVCTSLVVAINKLPKKQSNILSILWSIIFIGLTYVTSQNWEKANQVKENYLNNLERLSENNLLLINTPDNFNGAYILRNGVNDYLKFKETGKTATQIDFQTFTNVNGGITFLENNGFKGNKGASFYYKNPKLKTLKKIEKDALPFNMYDAVYYFSDGKFSKIEKP
ncbi:MAG: hypothetical protein P8L20_05505 [Flavobacteriales bacterium]|nr:hypothetical protein [Flavobacteriales bacterium]